LIYVYVYICWYFASCVSFLRLLWWSVRSIIANDLSLSAVNLIKANITHNGLDPQDPSTEQAKVRVNQGDAWSVVFSQ
jgi:tRNA G26 N,N-dimethylase Trm1